VQTWDIDAYMRALRWLVVGGHKSLQRAAIVISSEAASDCGGSAPGQMYFSSLPSKQREQKANGWQYDYRQKDKTVNRQQHFDD
jgi:hypothetical protein